MPGGRPPRPAELVALPDLAETLEDIAATGGESFYRGRLAKRIAADARRFGAALDEDDLAAHRNAHGATRSVSASAAWTCMRSRRTGRVWRRCWRSAFSHRLGIGDHAPESAEALHLQIEAMKLAFADAHRLSAIPTIWRRSCKACCRPTTWTRRASSIDRAARAGPRRRRTASWRHRLPVAADASGMMVSFIQSNYAGFGSGVVVPGTGISLQNRGAGFSLDAGHPNAVGGGKRPFHTIIPGFAMRAGKPEIAFGLMGGSMQAQGHVQLMLRMELWGQDSADRRRRPALAGALRPRGSIRAGVPRRRHRNPQAHGPQGCLGLPRRTSPSAAHRSSGGSTVAASRAPTRERTGAQPAIDQSRVGTSMGFAPRRHWGLCCALTKPLPKQLTRRL